MNVSEPSLKITQTVWAFRAVGMFGDHVATEYIEVSDPADARNEAAKACGLDASDPGLMVFPIGNTGATHHVENYRKTG